MASSLCPLYYHICVISPQRICCYCFLYLSVSNLVNLSIGQSFIDEKVMVEVFLLTDFPLFIVIPELSTPAEEPLTSVTGFSLFSPEIAIIASAFSTLF